MRPFARPPQHGMYPGVVGGKGHPWAVPAFFMGEGAVLGFIVGVSSGDALFTAIASATGVLLGAAIYTKAGTVNQRLAALQRSLGPDHYRFDISMDWPIDGLMQFIIDRLAERGLQVFPIAPGFVGISKEAIARLRYGYVIGPLNKQLLVLQTVDLVQGPFTTRAINRMCYIIVVRPFKRGTPPKEDPVVRTVGQLLWEFELLRWRKGFPPTVPMRWLSAR